MPLPQGFVTLAAVLGLALSGCSGDPKAGCADCDAIVVAAIGEPPQLLPPLVEDAVGRDIGDQVFEHLATLAPGAAPIDTAAYRPALAATWERVDSLSWRFHVRDGARWSDGTPVTAEDVVFSFDAYADSTVDAAQRGDVAGRLRAVADGPTAVRIVFTSAYPEQLYDATQHVRILPKHVWAAIPRGAWRADTALAHLVGSGPYRVVEWKRGEYVRLGADTTRAPRPAIARVIWRFAGDPDAALNLVLSHQADVLETVGPPARAQRVEADSALHARRYPAAVYGFLAFNVSARAAAHPVLGDRQVRAALAAALDRAALAAGIFGPGTVVPDGPMSQVLWLHDSTRGPAARDSAAAARMLDEAGWKPDAKGVRRRGGRALAFDILIPATSGSRRQLAQALQAAWKGLGVETTVTGVDFPVFQERLAKGKFDSYIGAYLDAPSPRGLSEQWSAPGTGNLNYGGYANAAFDALLTRAERESDPAAARARWREAFDTLAADAPAIFLYSPVNVAAVSRRIEGMTIDPFSWAATLPTWRKVP